LKQTGMYVKLSGFLLAFYAGDAGSCVFYQQLPLEHLVTQ